MYYKKIADFFKNKGLKNKEVAEILGYSEQMIGRYLKGKDKFNSEFVLALVKYFPEIDLQYIFSDVEEITVLGEPTPELYLNVDFELRKIEDKIGLIREYLARKGHEK